LIPSTAVVKFKFLDEDEKHETSTNGTRWWCGSHTAATHGDPKDSLGGKQAVETRAGEATRSQ